MRKIFTAAIAALMLGSCAAGSDVVPTGSATAQFLADVLADCKIACSFVPDINVITGIFSTGDPLLATPSAIATAICDMINKAGPQVAMDGKRRLRLLGAPLVINGVTVTGHFVNGARVGHVL
jgi:hypothetical protein